MYWTPSNSFSARTDEVDNHVAYLFFEQCDRVVHLHSSSIQASSVESPPFAPRNMVLAFPEHVLERAEATDTVNKLNEALSRQVSELSRSKGLASLHAASVKSKRCRNRRSAPLAQ